MALISQSDSPLHGFQQRGSQTSPHLHSTGSLWRKPLFPVSNIRQHADLGQKPAARMDVERRRQKAPPDSLAFRMRTLAPNSQHLEEQLCPRQRGQTMCRASGAIEDLLCTMTSRRHQRATCSIRQWQPDFMSIYDDKTKLALHPSVVTSPPDKQTLHVLLSR